MKITVLSDNHSYGPLKSEWGLSLLIDTGLHRILLDTGDSSLFAENATNLGLDLSIIDISVLSHAHHDHSGGLFTFFEKNRIANVYLSSDADENCYHKKGLFLKYNGIKKGTLSRFHDRFIPIIQDTEISSDIYILRHSIDNIGFIGKREKMYIRRGIHFSYDSFRHEVTLVIREKAGLVVFCSCSHGGVGNILSEVRNVFPSEKILAYIGGFHTHNKTKAELEQFADQLNQYPDVSFYTSHCTGDCAYSYLKTKMNHLSSFSVGEIIEI